MESSENNPGKSIKHEEYNVDFLLMFCRNNCPFNNSIELSRACSQATQLMNIYHCNRVVWVSAMHIFMTLFHQQNAYNANCMQQQEILYVVIAKFNKK